MSLLLIALPPGPPADYAFATSADGQDVATHGSAAPALLPAAGRAVEVVAVVPAARLSWQRVNLPRGVGPGSPRLRGVLEGLLEDQLLDEPPALHFALQPGAQPGGSAWVAVCERAWLAAHLAALEAVGRAPARIVPELTPDDGPARLWLTGEPARAWLLMSGDGVPGGAQALPFGPGTAALLPATGAAAPELLAEPAVAALAEQSLQRPVAIRSAAQRLLQASLGAGLAQHQLGALAHHAELGAAAQALAHRGFQRAQRLVVAQPGQCLQGLRFGAQPLQLLGLRRQRGALRLGLAQRAQRRRHRQQPDQRQPQHAGGQQHQAAFALGQARPGGGQAAAGRGAGAAVHEPLSCRSTAVSPSASSRRPSGRRR